MALYPFVPAYYRLGKRKGPVKAFLVHMAEGHGTVGYLSRANPNRVSVHFVIERTGRIVQMLPEDEASGSLNPTQLRTDNDRNGLYGVTAARLTMGMWWPDPNSALISVEVEGFAVSGPNSAQAGSLRTLRNDLRTRYPNMGNLGHRDFQNYKACPGPLIPWTLIGGHGPVASEEPFMRAFVFTDAATAGWYTVKGPDHLYLDLRTNKLHPIADGNRKRGFGPVHLTDGGITGIDDPRKSGYLIGAQSAFMLTEDGTWQPDQSGTALQAKIDAALAALK